MNNKFHVTLLAVLYAGVAVLGAVAVSRTTHLGAAAQHTNDKAVAVQSHQLDAYAAQLKKQLKTRPPALPKVPKAASAPGGSPVSASAPRIVYHQPPPIIIHKHHHGDDGSGDGGGGGGGD